MLYHGFLVDTVQSILKIMELLWWCPKNLRKLYEPPHVCFVLEVLRPLLTIYTIGRFEEVKSVNISILSHVLAYFIKKSNACMIFHDLDVDTLNVGNNTLKMIRLQIQKIILFLLI